MKRLEFPIDSRARFVRRLALSFVSLLALSAAADVTLSVSETKTGVFATKYTVTANGLPDGVTRSVFALADAKDFGATTEDWAVRELVGRVSSDRPSVDWTPPAAWNVSLNTVRFLLVEPAAGGHDYECAYFASNGRSWVDLGVTPAQTDKMRMKFTYDVCSGSSYGDGFLGNKMGSESLGYRFYREPSGNVLLRMLEKLSQSSQQGFYLTAGTVCEVEIFNRGLTRLSDGTQLMPTKSSVSYADGTFGSFQLMSATDYGSIYYLEFLTADNEVLHRFRPVVFSDGHTALHDEVAGGYRTVVDGCDEFIPSDAIDRICAAEGSVYSAAYATALVPSEFERSATLTVKGYDGAALSDFPVLVRLGPSAIPGFDYSQFKAPDAIDLKFVGTDGNECPYEIDEWNPSGESLVWVRMPSVAKGAALTCLWGCGAMTAPSPKRGDTNGLWRAQKYYGVYHLNEPSGTAKCSACPELAAVPSAGANGDTALMVGAAGKVGTARYSGHAKTTAAGNCLRIPNPDGYADSQTGDSGKGQIFTASGWFRLASSSDVGEATLMSRKNAHADNEAWEWYMNGSATSVMLRGRSSSLGWGGTVPDMSSEWVYLTVAYGIDSYYENVYVNGVFQLKQQISRARDNGRDLCIGNAPSGALASFGGWFDEIRLRAGVSDADWIRAEYATMSDASFFDVSASGDRIEGDYTVALAEVTSVAAATLHSASVGLNVKYFGEGASSVAVRARYARAGSSVTNTVTLATLTAVGATDLSLDGLNPGSDYALDILVDNGIAPERSIGAFACSTPAENSCPSWYAGLYQNRRGDRTWYEAGTTVEQILTDRSWSADETNARTLAPEAGYTATADCWPAWGPNAETGLYTDDYSIFNWGDNRTYAYVGWMHFEDATYTFGGKMDDNVAVWVDDAEVLNQWGSTFATASWTPADGAGWHKVRILVWNGSTAYGPWNTDDFNGICWNTNGYLVCDKSANWQTFRDPGDGSLLRTEYLAAPVVSASYLLDDGARFGATVNFTSAHEGLPVCLCTAADYGAFDTNAWTVTELAAVGAGESSRVVAVDLPSGARFVRFAVRRGDDWFWDRTIAVKDLELLDTSRPIAGLESVLATTRDTATFAVSVTATGPEPTCRLDFDFAFAGAGRVHRTVSFEGVAAGVTNITVGGLRPGRAYEVTVTPHADGAAGATSAALAFETEPSEPFACHYAGYDAKVSGLVQTITTNVYENAMFDQDVTDLPHTVVQGAGLAYTSSGWTAYETVVWDGLMHFEKGTYDFISSIDDAAIVVIGGEKALDQPVYKADKTGSWTCPATGWYPIRLGAANYTVGGGPIVNHADTAFHYSTDGGTTWNAFVGTGDGTLFITNCPVEAVVERPFGVASDGGVISGYAFERSETSSRYGTFYIENAAKTFRSVSSQVYVTDGADAALSESVAASGGAGIALSFSGYLLAGGTNGTATVKIRIGTREDLSDATEYLVGEFESAATFEKVVDATPGTDYYWQAIAVENGLVADTTPIRLVHAHAAAKLNALITASGSNWNATFGGLLEDAGAGSHATVTLYTGASADSLTNTASVVMTEPGAISFPIEFSFMHEKVYYKLAVENAVEGHAYASETDVGSFQLEDTFNYYWKADVAEGDWTDSANWTDSSGNPLDPRCIYPDSDSSAVTFPAGETPVLVRLGKSSVACSKVAVSSGARVTVASAGATISTVNNGWNGELTLGSDASFTLDGTALRTNAALTPNKGSTFRLVNGAYYCSGREIWHHRDSLISVESGSTLEIKGYQYEMYASDARLVVDNATFSDLSGVTLLGKTDASLTNLVTIAGANPVFRARNFAAGTVSVGEMPEIRFDVPATGYAAAPVQRYSQSDNREPFASAGAQKILFSIARGSAAYATRETFATPLLEWKYGINTNNVELGEIKSARAAFAWTYGTDGAESPATEGDLPTGLKVTFFRAAGLTLSVR